MKEPGILFSKIPVTFRARNYILKSKSVEWWCSFKAENQLDLFRQKTTKIEIFKEIFAHIKIAFWARKVIGTFERRATGGLSMSKLTSVSGATGSITRTPLDRMLVHGWVMKLREFTLQCK